MDPNIETLKQITRNILKAEALHKEVTQILSILNAPRSTEIVGAPSNLKMLDPDLQGSGGTETKGAGISPQPDFNAVQRTAVTEQQAVQVPSRLSLSLLLRYNRDQLYEQVWSTPMRKLAVRYSVSDVALAKTCRKLLIPVPGRGYWAKKAANQPVEPRPPLPIVQIWPMKSADKEPRCTVPVGDGP